MPLGKNSIKRVQNNGYSQVKTGAPDMENSTVIESTDTPVAETKKETERTPVKGASSRTGTKKTAPKKAAPKKAKNGGETAPVSNKIPTPTDVAQTVSPREGEGYVNIGGQMPLHLL